jgi:thioredoxin reductase (NADPH)
MKSRSYIIAVLCGMAVFTACPVVSESKSEKNITIEQLQNVSNLVPVAVIGGGPAGLSAALYSARGKMHTVVFSGPELGGQLSKTLHVENWPGTERTNGIKLMNVVKAQAQKFGAEVADTSITKVDFSSWPFTLWTDTGDIVHALSIVIATGGIMRTLGVPGEDKYLGRGVARCGICDSAFFKDQDVVVVGSGDAAVQDAVMLLDYAKNVILLVAGSAMKAAQCMQDRLLAHKNVRVLYNTQVTAIKGNGKVVTGVDIVNRKDGTTSSLGVAGVFVGIGQIPNTALFESQLKKDKRGYIVINRKDQATSVPGIYAAGAVSEDQMTQAAISSGDAIRAVLNAMEFLNKHGITNQNLKQYEKQYYQIPDAAQ